MAGRQILLVEDDMAIADMYALRLRQSGWRVEIAPDGEQALRSALKEPPELVLLDMMLPGIDGMEVLTRLRQAAATRSVRVIVLSNSNRPLNWRRRAEELGILDWHVKATMTPMALSEKVSRVLGPPSTSPRPHAPPRPPAPASGAGRRV